MVRRRRRTVYGCLFLVYVPSPPCVPKSFMVATRLGYSTGSLVNAARYVNFLGYPDKMATGSAVLCFSPYFPFSHSFLEVSHHSSTEQHNFAEDSSTVTRSCHKAPWNSQPPLRPGRMGMWQDNQLTLHTAKGDNRPQSPTRSRT